MREILFRGKTFDNDWVEGFYVNQFRAHEIYCLDDSDYETRHVNPSTVGQYTGLTDKNGKKIFEGDVVVVPLSGKPAKGIVEYFKTDICGFAVITQPQYSNYVLQKNYAYEVIGNIYDNPELLEVEE